MGINPGKRVLVILVDAFRHDYLTPEKTPFLNSLLPGSFFAPLHPILGYSDAIRATIFTGAYPRDHDYWILYRYQPESSPFKSLHSLGIVDRLPWDFGVRGFKFVLSAFLTRTLAMNRGYAEMSTHHIPYRLIGNFDYSLRRSMLAPDAFPGYPTIFDVMRETGQKYAYIDSFQLGFFRRFGSCLLVKERLLQKLQGLDPDCRLVFLYLHHLDYFAHRLGITSGYFQKELGNVDGLLRDVLTSARAKFGNDLEVIIFSDHGMADARRFLDPRWLVRDRRLGKDYLLFLDSTLVHVWYLNPACREEVRTRIERLGCGNFLSPAEKARLNLDFNHRAYGDDLYLLEPGYQLFPNFVSWLKPHAMHAYHPDHPSQTGIFLWLDKGNNPTIPDPVELVEIAPTLLQTLGLTAPETCRGKPLKLPGGSTV